MALSVSAVGVSTHSDTNVNSQLKHTPSGAKNPFENRASSTTKPPTLPQPCALLPSTHAKTVHQTADDAYKSSSWSSAGSVRNGSYPVDLEKQGLAQDYEPRHSRRASRQYTSNHDPEKQSQFTRHTPDHSHCASDADVGYQSTYDEDLTSAEQLQQANAVKILLFFCAPCVGLSLANALWTFMAFLLTTLMQPLRLCTSRSSFSTQVADLTSPVLRLHMRCIYTNLPPYAHEATVYNVGGLAMVHLFSPLLSLGVMLTAWVVAIYWLLAKIVDDPAGIDKRDDGLELVLWLRDWWERWLMRALLETY